MKNKRQNTRFDINSSAAGELKRLEKPGTVLLESHPSCPRERSWLFTDPVETLACHNCSEVLSVLRRIDEATSSGLFAAGYLAYEAAPAMEPSMKVAPGCPVPLCWFGIYRKRQRFTSPVSEPGSPFNITEWQPELDENEYRDGIAAVRKLIYAGDTYQVNFTFRMHAELEGNPTDCYRRIFQAQQSAYSAYINTGRFRILSASPELFIKKNGLTLESRPMKGTAARGRWSEDDNAMHRHLAECEKNRAENVMIVDMIRNDMSRVAEKGTVTTKDMFQVQRYPTLLQMISTVRCRSSAPASEIFKALFPCASITGAPKIRTMQIISDLEKSPRGVYCGAIGFAGPGNELQFNVAIRTMTHDSDSRTLTYGTGGGITWGSSAADEYDECLVKARILAEPPPEFELLETILYDSHHDYYLLPRHMDRLVSSASYFNYSIDLPSVRKSLDTVTARLPAGKYRLRLLLERDGSCQVQAFPLEKQAARPRTGFATCPVNTTDRFLYHKTTNRVVYEKARASRPDCDEVLLWNERGEITEASIANVVLRINGEFLTPPLECGLLPGTMRAQLLAAGKVREQVLHKEDVATADKVILVNSVRGWREAEWAPDE